MKKFLLAIAAVCMAMTMSAQSNEIGAVVGGYNGVSFKHYFTENWALQADLVLDSNTPMVHL